MRLSVNIKDINAAVTTVTRALPSKPQIGILEGICLRAKGSELILLCSDLTIEIETRIAATIDEEGETVVQGKLFAEIVRKMPEGEIDMQTNGEAMLITSGKARASLQTLHGDVFPSMARESGCDTLRVPQRALKDMVMKIAFSAALESPRAVLTGINVMAIDNKLILAALDGYRLAVRRERIEAINKIFSCTVPCRSFLEIVKLLDDCDDDIELMIGDTHMTVELKDTVITVRLIDGNFLDYKKMIPTQSETTVCINTRNFYMACERAALLANTASGVAHIVKFEFFFDKVLMNAVTELGQADEDIDVVLSGKELTIYFNVRYLLDVLKNIEDEEFCFDITGNRSACLMRPVEGDKYNYVVVPLNR
ncbi:MAG: DNA polymerase III subunit beta [Clostridia bacterium]